MSSPERDPGRKPARNAVARSAPHEVHLIGGRWKRSRLAVPDREGLRPTPSRVRETLFNWLGQDLAGWVVLDAFAGSGALGLEAASRGAEQVTLLERDPGLAAALRATGARLRGPQAAATEPPHLQVVATDAITWMGRAAPDAFDLVLLDPPYAAGLTERALVVAAPLVRRGGWLYVESDLDTLALPAGLVDHREGRAGAVRYRLLRRSD